MASGELDFHQDGLGSGGTVEAAILYAEEGPLWGGYTCFCNIVNLALELARDDIESFRSLFRHDAVTIFRTSGSRAIKITSPILFIGEQKEPQVFFRCPGGEYDVDWDHSDKALERGVRFLLKHTQPFSTGTSFAALARRGFGCIIRNNCVLHGRTAFIDGSIPGTKRMLSRKWFSTSAAHAHFQHAPGMRVLDEYVSLFPEQFSPQYLDGEWVFDPVSGKNVRSGLL